MYYYNYTRKIYKNVDDEWKKLERIEGICEECNKYSYEITKDKKICYRCFDYYFYENE